MPGIKKGYEDEVAQTYFYDCEQCGKHVTIRTRYPRHLKDRGLFHDSKRGEICVPVQTVLWIKEK